MKVVPEPAKHGLGHRNTKKSNTSGPGKDYDQFSTKHRATFAFGLEKPDSSNSCPCLATDDVFRSALDTDGLAGAMPYRRRTEAEGSVLIRRQSILITTVQLAKVFLRHRANRKLFVENLEYTWNQ
uniref:Uncharacterized protein n=1 Tax=Anopheles coluzzii TaxID=1518534 RepID=A0A8W7Q143_ANOCL